MPVSDLDLLREAAFEAGEIAKRFFGNGPETWDKGDSQGPVTEADLAIDAMLKDKLLSARPDYGWLSEETEDGTARLSKERVFIIDPIDGTRAFIEGSKNFSHSLAIAENGKATTAVVHLPLLDRCFAAALGQGATLNGTPISPTTRTELSGATTLSAKPMLNPDLWPGGVPPIKREFRSSLAYRMCLVANARFDAMVTLRDAWEWDIAAGTLIVEEAGGIVSDRTAQPLRYNNPHPKLPGVIATNHALHAQFMDHLLPKTA